MSTINVYGAGARALALKTDTGADCLVVADTAILQGTAATRHAASAEVEWGNTPGKVKGKLPPHAGFPGYWSGPAGYGDVCVYLGDDKWAGIDSLNGVYHKGTINIQTTAQRTAQVGGEYLGHSTEMLGHQLVYVPPIVPDPTGDPHFKGAVLLAGEKLTAGDYLKAENYKLIKQTDGHLVEYRLSGASETPVWSTGPKYEQAVHPELGFFENQPDGNVVDYGLDKKGKPFPIFATMTNSKAFRGSHLKLVSDGRVVLIRPDGAMKTIITARS
jgi:hypothetical protein